MVLRGIRIAESRVQFSHGPKINVFTIYVFCFFCLSALAFIFTTMLWRKRYGVLNKRIEIKDSQISEQHKKYCSLYTELVELKKLNKILEDKSVVKSQQIAAANEKQIKRLVVEKLQLIEKDIKERGRFKRGIKQLAIKFHKKIMDFANFKTGMPYNLQPRNGEIIPGAFSIDRAFIAANGEPTVEFLKCMMCGAVVTKSLAEYHFFLSHQSLSKKIA